MNELRAGVIGTGFPGRCPHETGPAVLRTIEQLRSG